MDRAANSQIVQEQLAHPDIDVFTGKTFDELHGEAKQGVDLTACSPSTRRRSRAHSRSIRPRSPVRPSVWMLSLVAAVVTSTFLALASGVDRQDHGQSAHARPLRASLTVWSSRPSKCSSSRPALSPISSVRLYQVETSSGPSSTVPQEPLGRSRRTETRRHIQRLC